MLTETIIKAFETLEGIANVSSTLAKQEILKNNSENDVLCNLLMLAYNPFLVYNVKKIPTTMDECTTNQTKAENYVEFLSLLLKLKNREITGNLALDTLSNFLKQCNKEEYKWYTRVLKKDLEIGMADKGINKVIKNLIPTYEVMLADKIKPEDLNLDTPKALKMLPNRIVCQYKIDGYRLNIHTHLDGTISIRTRNGKFVTGYNDLEAEVKAKLPKGFVFDGEIVAPELFEWINANAGNETTTANRDLFSEVMSHAFSKEENKQGIFNVFDMIPISEWENQEPTETYEQRLQRLEELKALDLKHIMVVPTSRVFNKNNKEDLKEIVELFHQFINIGWEGLMVKNLDAKYEWKRTKNLIKMKMMDTIDLEVLEVFEGEGKYKGMLGGVIVDYKGFKVGVGSGWSDEQREYYWNNTNEIIGKTIEVTYQAETKNKKGELSLSFPVVKGVRFDK